MDIPCFAADGKTKVYGSGHVGAMPLMVRAVAFNALYHEAEALRKDAERYRHMRKHCASVGMRGREWIWDQPDAEEAFDDMVDASMAIGAA